LPSETTPARTPSTLRAHHVLQHIHRHSRAARSHPVDIDLEIIDAVIGDRDGFVVPSILLQPLLDLPGISRQLT
jgi:hypothetical protein